MRRYDQTEAVAVQLARHFQEAGIPEKSIQYLQQAGERAVRLSANEEAIAYFNQALAVIETLPESLERTQRELTLQIALYAPLGAARGYAAPEVEKAFSRARELCEQVGEPTHLFLVLYGLWGYSLVGGRLQTANELAEQCLTLAQSIQDPSLLPEAHRTAHDTAYFRGEFARCRKHFEQAFPLYDPQQHHGHAAIYAQDPGVALLSVQSLNLWQLGFPDQALRMSQEAVRLARDLSHPFSLAYSLAWATGLYQEWNDVQKTLELAEATIALSTEHDFALWLACANVWWGWALAEQGEAEEGIRQMRQSLADYRATGAQAWTTAAFAMLVEQYGKVGQIEEGLALLTEALAMVESNAERFVEAELYQLKGELLLMRGEAEAEVEACFRQAIEVARSQQDKMLELRATVSLCRLWRRQGKREEARQMLAEIYGWFTEGFDTADLKEAKALLAELS